jgi:hypothetical protein
VCISCTEFFTNCVDNREKFRLRSSVECVFRCTEFHETIPHWPYLQIFYEYIKFAQTGQEIEVLENSFKPLNKVWLSLSGFSRNSFALQLLQTTSIPELSRRN